MRGTTFGGRIVGSPLFAHLKQRAATYVNNPQQLQDLLRKARARAESAGGEGVLRDLWSQLMVLLRFIRAYANGDYRQVPLQTVLLVVAAVLYFVMPIDVIPDVVVGLGYVDDAAVIAWVVKTVAGELDAFGRWEAARSSSR